MSSALENAKRKLAELEKEIEQIQLFIDMYGLFSETDTAPVSNSTEKRQRDEGVRGNISTSQGYPQVKTPKKHHNSPTPRQTIEIIERMIREIGQPMSRGEIVAALEARDVELPAEDKPRYIGTIMWRNKSKFQNLEGRGYWVRNEPLHQPKKFESDESDEIDNID